MELNIFTEQLNKCYNLLSQQIVIIKQLTDLTNRLSALSTTFEDLVRETPTDVRVVKDQGKWQLQLEHDTNVLSIDEGLQTALNENKLYRHQLTLTIGNYEDYTGETTINIDLLVLSTNPNQFNNPEELVNTGIIFVEKFFTYDDEGYSGVAFIYDGSSEYRTLLAYYTPYDRELFDIEVKAIVSDTVY